MLQNKKILLAEDDEDLRMIISDKLKGLNCTLTSAKSGNEAILLLENGLQVDFVVSDYSMNDGDGADLLKYVSEKKPGLPFVFFTNNPDPYLPVQYEHFHGVIFKLKFDELAKTILNSLDNRTQPSV